MTVAEKACRFESLKIQPSPAAFWLSSWKVEAPSPWGKELMAMFPTALLDGVVSAHEADPREIPAHEGSRKAVSRKRFK